LAIYREMADKRGVAVELNNIADQLLSMGDPIGARKTFEESLGTYREIGHQDGVAMSKSNLGGLLLELGDSEGARKMYEESLEICRKIGDRSKAAGDLAGIGTVMRTAGELDRARKYLSDAMSEFVNIGDRSSAAEVEISLAEILIDQHNVSESVGMARSAAEEFEREKAPRDESLAESVLARALLAQGEVAEAQKAIQTATALSHKFHDRQVELSVEVNAARVRVAAGSARERATAVDHLQQVLAEATRRGFVNGSLEVRLALGEIELASDKRSARSNLETLQKDANERGFRWIAQQANAALRQVSIHQ
jgi:tetratricopeptide (TPR) repeat protein